VLIIVGVIMFFTQPGTHPVLLAFRVGLVAVGLVGLIILTLLNSRPKRDTTDVHAVAREILDHQKQLFGAPQEHAAANLDDFPDLDRSFYEGAQSALESQDFAFIEDVENTTLSRALPALRTFVRTMVGDGDTIVARIFQLLPSGRAGRDIRTIELTTEFTDFTFLVTTNAALALDAPDIRGITIARFSPETSAVDLLGKHRAALAALRAKNPSLQPVRCSTLDAVLTSTRHAHAVRAVHRKRNGYVTLDDMKLIRGEPLTDLDREIFEGINQLEASDRAAESRSDSADDQGEDEE